MSFENYFPLWNDLNTAQKKVISDNLITRNVKRKIIIHNEKLDRTVLLLVKSGSFELTYFQMKDVILYFTACSIWICLLSAS